MNIEYIDTTKVYESSLKIDKLIVEYNTLIEEMFNKVNQMPNTTKEWIGQRAEEYVNLALIEKSDYINFGKKISEYSNYLKRISESFENTISKNRNMEEGI